MTDTVKIILGMLIPFFGTAAGSATVFFLKEKIRPALNRALMGFASGVMFAASVWSLIIPSIEMASGAVFSWFPAFAGFVCGTAAMLALDRMTDRFFGKGGENQNGRTVMMALAITIHNIPEGMAVGVVFASAISGESDAALAGAFAFSAGIAIQNVPEGSIISMPLRSAGVSKGRSFVLGALSGVVEPIGAAATLVLTSVISAALPYILSFAAGAMIYVVVEELIPKARGDGDADGVCAVSVTVGFLIMMILDVALG